MSERTHARRPSAKQAKRWALRVYRAAFKAAEKGNWNRARLLIAVGHRCKFCVRHTPEDQACPICKKCEVQAICGEEPDEIPRRVLFGEIVPQRGQLALARTIRELEALEV